MSQIKDGKYTGARIVDYGIRPDKDDKPRVWVSFQIMDGDNTGILSWSGDFSTVPIQAGDKSFVPQKITLDNLEKMGFKGGLSAVPALYDGKESKLLNEILDFDIEVKGGYVKYINLPGEGPGKKFSSKAEMLASFAKAGVVASGPSKNYLG